MNYYISKKGRTKGPYNLEELRHLNLLNTTLIWREGMKAWQPASKLYELKEIIITLPPALPKDKSSIQYFKDTICHWYVSLLKQIQYTKKQVV